MKSAWPDLLQLKCEIHQSHLFGPQLLLLFCEAVGPLEDGGSRAEGIGLVHLPVLFPTTLVHPDGMSLKVGREKPWVSVCCCYVYNRYQESRASDSWEWQSLLPQ